MSKRKKIAIILLSTIGGIIFLFGLITAVSFLIFHYGGINNGYHFSKYPFKDRTTTYKNHTFSKVYQNNKIEFHCDEIQMKISKISKDDYINANLKNVFYDYRFDSYYKIELKIKANNKIYVATVFNNVDENIPHRQSYTFDIEIENQVYQSCLILRNSQYGESCWFY